MKRRSLLTAFGMSPFAGGMMAREASDPQREAIRARYFPDVVLHTHEGKKVRFYRDLIKDKIVMINFMYAHCDGICPGITANLVKVQRLLGDRVGRDIFMYSLSYSFSTFGPKVLKEYAQMHGVRPGWKFLTGHPQDVELLRRKLGARNLDPVLDADTSQHTGIIRYGNEPMRWWAACPGLSRPAWIVESVSWVDWPKNRVKPG